MTKEEPKQDRIVLSEDVYTSTLSQIIQRDFYPSLTDLQRQCSILDRRLNNDVPGAVAVRRAARKLDNHERALAQQELEDENDLVDGARKKARPLHQENLTGFHARATNEDDHEFDSQQKKQVQANRDRLDKLFQPPSSQDLKMIEYNSESAADQFQPESNRITNWAQPKVRNGLFFAPTPLRGDKESESEKQHLLTNGSGSNDSKEVSLMPPPASKKPAKAIAKHALVEYVPKQSLEKKIEPSQTRFPRTIVPFQNKGSRYDTNLQCSETEWSTDASTDLDAPMRSIDEERRRRERTSTREKQSYVTMTPLLVPGAGNQSPITTWGEIDSTPLVLSGSDNPEGNSAASDKKSFSLAAENDRDRAARKAQKQLEKRAKRAKSTSRKRSRDHGGSLAPAAMSLLEKHKRTPSRQRDAFASALRGSYTPKTRAGSSGPTSRKSRSRDNAYNATPLASRQQQRK